MSDVKRRADAAIVAFYEIVKAPRASRLRMRQAIRMMLDHMQDMGDARLCCQLINLLDAIEGEPAEVVDR